ncbi:hypothetical protein SAMN05444167_2284 [Terriglobus roseus]|uniref:Uncharacterized protein n=1 Tax=Terriglobus roseus TaxID=392734 RepID=A0A1G7KRU8_9BACT|nr:hypothetical protein SAMN05444167_2284 [Terriglobus roseus]
MDAYTQLERYLHLAGDTVWFQQLPASAARQTPYSCGRKFALAEGDLSNAGEHASIPFNHGEARQIYPVTGEWWY